MAKKPNHRARLHWIVTALVLAVIAYCIFTTLDDKQEGWLDFDTLNLPSSELWQDILGEFLQDGSQQNMENATEVFAPIPGAKLEVHFINVEQGDSTLVKGPEANLLIDAGENNMGDRVVSYLEKQGVTTLDYVIGTHPHSDHIGGLDVVINSLSVRRVILPVIPEPLVPATRTYTDLLEAIQDNGLKITAARPGKTYNLGDGAVLTILGPMGEYSDLNNMSVVSRLVYGETAFVFTGDACIGAESDIVDSGADLSADVLDTAHHGSSSSSCEAFLDAVSPTYAAISCAVDNSYGHPHRETVEKFKERGVHTFRTDRNGSIIVYSNGSELGFSTEK